MCRAHFFFISDYFWDINESSNSVAEIRMFLWDVVCSDFKRCLIQRNTFL